MHAISAPLIHVVVRVVTLGLLFNAPAALAAAPVVKILGIGQGFVVPPDQPVKVQYRVSPDQPGNHSFYLDDSLLLVRESSRIGRNASGTYSITYPAGLARDRVVSLRICAEAAPAAACDEISLRAGEVLMPVQTVEVSPPGVAGHLPPQSAFEIGYSLLQPAVSEQILASDDVPLARRTATRPNKPQSFPYPGSLSEGERHLLRICVDDSTAICGFARVTGGQPPQGVDLPEPFSVANLGNHYQVVPSCDPVCGYYGNVYYGDRNVSWIPDRGDGQPDGLRVDLYYSGTDGRLNAGAAPSTLVIYAHSAGINKEALLASKRSVLKHLMNIPKSGGAGVVVASADFRHPIKQLNDDRTPVSLNDLSYLVQFARHYAAELNINPDDIFLVGSSLGGGASIHAGVREIANPSDPSPIRQRSSVVRGVFSNDGQASFAPLWFRSQFLEPPVAAIYRTDLLDDETRSIYGHAIAQVNSNAPLMELLYSSPFIAHKVTLSEYLSGSVDLVHLPNLALVLEAQYRLYGIGERIRVRERYAGNFGRDAAKFVSDNRLGRE